MKNIEDIDNIEEFIHYGFGGRILERKGNVITKFHIDEISIQIKQDDNKPT